MKAISKNVNLGVIFEVRTTRSYGWVIEDDFDPATAPNWASLRIRARISSMQPTARRPASRPCPSGVVFDPPEDCASIGSADRFGLRFNRLGSVCGIGAADCARPRHCQRARPFINTAGRDVNICLRHTRDGLRRLLTVNQSGRVTSRPIGGA